MSHLKLIAACGFCFLLGTLFPQKHVHAQTNNHSETYYLISFMKTKPGQDALKMEQELWKPIQLERVNKGEIESWTVMQPLFSGPHPYDYLTVETASNIDKLTHADFAPTITKAWGKEKYSANLERTMNARDMLGNEVWVFVDGISKRMK